MDKINTQTPDLTDKNIAKIAELFPNVITEKEGEDGMPVKVVDFELLKQELAKDIVDGSEERYRLDWPGKRRSILKANTPINKTLVPDKESSVDFDNTKNIYIEGDNFEVLKILQESYLNKIKMIYIDPPYNTGKDFVYKDDFKKTKEEYEEDLGVEDEEGGRLFKNTDTNGRFHSDWLSMMYERLVIARDLLKDDGVIFISIDDNEVHNLRKICDEIFGEDNFIGMFSVENNPKGRKNGNFISVTNEYCLIYSKNAEITFFENIVPKHAADMTEDENGDFVRRSGKRVLMGENTLNKLVSNFKSPKHYSAYIKDFDIILKQENAIDDIDSILIQDGYSRYITFRDGCFVENTYTKEKFEELFKNGALDIRDSKIYEKHFSDMMQIKSTLTNNEYEAIVNNEKVIYKIDLKTTSAKQQLTELLGGEYFSFPKNISFIKHLISLQQDDSGVILDFFSGSATTAHAVMQLNAEDGGIRKFVMVQLPEQTDEKSEVYKAGYKTIAEIGRERIRRAGKKIIEENADKLKERETPLDIGFRAYKVADSIMQDVYKSPNDLKQGDLLGLADNIREDKKPEDILTSVILDLGLTLDLPIKEEKISKNTIFNVDDGSLVACFDKNIDFNVIDEIAKMKPLKVVFRDASFKDDKDRINVETKFKQISPDTNIKVI